MNKKKKKALTLMELIVVVIIVGILAAISIPQYTRARERAMDKQAQAILTLIRAAERSYFMETGLYYPTISTTEVRLINEHLGLDLIDDGKWGYSATNAEGFKVELSRSRGGYPRTWTINSTMVNASCQGCP